MACAIDDYDSEIESESRRTNTVPPLSEYHAACDALWERWVGARAKLAGGRGNGVALPHSDNNLESPRKDKSSFGNTFSSESDH